MRFSEWQLETLDDSEWPLMTHLLLTLDGTLQLSSQDQEVPNQGSKVPTLTIVDASLTYAGCGLFKKFPIRTIENQNAVVVTQ